MNSKCNILPCTIDIFSNIHKIQASVYQPNQHETYIVFHGDCDKEDVFDYRNHRIISANKLCLKKWSFVPVDDNEFLMVRKHFYENVEHFKWNKNT